MTDLIERLARAMCADYQVLLEPFIEQDDLLPSRKGSACLQSYVDEHWREFIEAATHGAEKARSADPAEFRAIAVTFSHLSALEVAVELFHSEEPKP